MKEGGRGFEISLRGGSSWEEEEREEEEEITEPRLPLSEPDLEEEEVEDDAGLEDRRRVLAARRFCLSLELLLLFELFVLLNLYEGFFGILLVLFMCEVGDIELILFELRLLKLENLFV